MADPDPAAEQMLRGLRAETIQMVAALDADFGSITEASRDTNADDEHDPEGATIAFERAQVAAVLQQAQERLAQIDAALARVAAGRYGICTACAGQIGAERLSVRPFAEKCLACAERGASGRRH